MDKATGENKGSVSFMGRPTVFDVGIGILYFFTSHMVIRAMYYIGVDRSSAELSVFFLTVIGSVILAHVLAQSLLRARLFMESSLGMPAVSLVAALGATLALVSMLPVVSVVLFYVSGALLGLSCGWIIVIWTSTIRPARPDSNSFYIDPSLAVAVASYFLFRCVSSFSNTIAQGFLLALPLVAIVCIIRGGKDGSDRGATIVGERAQALEVLVVVSAAFAIGCSVVVYLSGREDDLLSSGLNYMVLFEVLAVALMLLCCWVMYRFAGRKPALRPRGVAALTFCVCYIPMFLIGLIMGGAGIPERAPDALWESNIWVLLIAIFAYDIRDSLYAVKGLAVGLMFEAMCMGQLIARVSTLNSVVYPLVIALVLGLLYFASVCRQLFFGEAIKKATGADGRRLAKSREVVVAGVQPVVEQAGCGDGESGSSHGEARAAEEAGDEGIPSEIVAYCQKLALDYGLTPREAEILGLIAMGRSAKYIAEELLISYNTTRTHIKHVYEKLNIHAKQELIDLVLFGSGLM